MVFNTGNLNGQSSLGRSFDDLRMLAMVGLAPSGPLFFFSLWLFNILPFLGCLISS